MQSAGDLRRAGCGRQWNGDATAVTDILSLNAMPLVYAPGKGGAALAPLLRSTGFVTELARQREECDRWRGLPPKNGANVSVGLETLWTPSSGDSPCDAEDALIKIVKERDRQRGDRVAICGESSPAETDGLRPYAGPRLWVWCSLRPVSAEWKKPISSPISTPDSSEAASRLYECTCRT